MHLSIYVVNANKVVLKTCSYVIKSIKINIILENNMLELS